MPRHKYLIRLADWNLEGLFYWLQVDRDVKKLEGAGLNWRELGIEHKGGVVLAVHCHGVSGDGGEVTEQRAESVDGQSVIGTFYERLAVCGGGALCVGDD